MPREISVVPTGDLWLTGLYAESPYLRGLLDKIGVTPDFLHCGDYKSASEIFMREGPSPQAEEMQNWLLDSMYHDDDQADRQGTRRRRVERCASGSTAARTRPARPKSLGIIDIVQQRHDLEASAEAAVRRQGEVRSQVRPQVAAGRSISPRRMRHS